MLDCYKKLHGEDRNIKIIPNYIDKLKAKFIGENKEALRKSYYNKMIQEAFGKNMRFDVVIGNPPYQENTGGAGKQSKTLYDRFIFKGIELSDRITSMITNNTFLTNDAKSELRNTMIENGLSTLVNYPISGDIFRGIGVACCIFVIDKTNTKHTMTYKRIENNRVINKYTSVISIGDIIPESQYEIIIANKVKSKRTMADILLGEKTFGLSTKGRKGFVGGEPIIETSVIPFDGAIQLLHTFNGYEEIGYIDEKELPKGKEYINCYKVICPRIVTKQSINSLNKAIVIEPNIVCTQHWSTISAFNNVELAHNLKRYIQTELFRFLIYVFCSNGVTGLNTTLLSHVPFQDFTNNSDIDWSKPISDIDQQLYKKYELTQEEIDYIEKTIKPME